MNLPLTVMLPGPLKSFDTIGLLDTGSTGSYISQNLVARHNIDIEKLNEPITAYNADGTANTSGKITHYAILEISIGNHKERMMFLVTNLGKADVFFGYEWVKHHNPEIDFQKGSIEFT